MTNQKKGETPIKKNFFLGLFFLTISWACNNPAGPSGLSDPYRDLVSQRAEVEKFIRDYLPEADIRQDAVTKYNKLVADASIPKINSPGNLSSLKELKKHLEQVNFLAAHAPAKSASTQEDEDTQQQQAPPLGATLTAQQLAKIEQKYRQLRTSMNEKLAKDQTSFPSDLLEGDLFEEGYDGEEKNFKYLYAYLELGNKSREAGTGKALEAITFISSSRDVLQRAVGQAKGISPKNPYLKIARLKPSEQAINDVLESMKSSLEHAKQYAKVSGATLDAIEKVIQSGAGPSKAPDVRGKDILDKLGSEPGQIPTTQKHLLCAIDPRVKALNESAKELDKMLSQGKEKKDQE